METACFPWRALRQAPLNRFSLDDWCNQSVHGISLAGVIALVGTHLNLIQSERRERSLGLIKKIFLAEYGYSSTNSLWLLVAGL